MWYYARGDERIGPVDEATFTAALEDGEISGDTLVWREGMADWQPYRSVRQAAAVPREAGATTACVQCGRAYPLEDMLQYEGDFVCAACKPAYFQRLQESGVALGTLNYAGFGQRLGAKVVDWILLGIANSALSAALFGAMALPAYAGDTFFSVAYAMTWVASLALGGAYTIFFLGRYGATPGKMAMSIEVIRPDGARLTYGRATGRYFAELVTNFTLFLGYIMAAFDKEHRSLHDLIADTRVVRKS